MNNASDHNMRPILLQSYNSEKNGLEFGTNPYRKFNHFGNRIR